MDSPCRLAPFTCSSDPSSSSRTHSSRDSSPDSNHEFHYQVPSTMDLRQHTALHGRGQSRQVGLFERNQQAFQQNLTLQTQQPYGAAAPRSAVSPNWRAQQTADNWMPSSASNNYMLASPTGPRNEILEAKLGGFAYCLDRGNGQYTRLVPADMLPAMVEIPARQNGPGGMVVLPALQASPPQGVPEMNRPVTIKSTGQGSDNIQKQIDRIVATSPSTPKKTKIYCDKWVHEGVCAFTQQGCKYKHEMPFDKATQHSLGLFQGFPPWWKKLQAEMQRQQETQEPLPSPSRARPLLENSAGGDKRGQILTQQPWRKGAAAASPGQSPPANHDSSETELQRANALRALLSNGPSNRCVWGPIEPPQKGTAEAGAGSKRSSVSGGTSRGSMSDRN